MRRPIDKLGELLKAAGLSLEAVLAAEHAMFVDEVPGRASQGTYSITEEERGLREAFRYGVLWGTLHRDPWDDVELEEDPDA